MTTIETKKARLNELQAEIKNITDELLGDENISDSRDAYLRSLRTDARREMEALKAAIDAETPVVIATTFKNDRVSVTLDGAKVSLDKATQILFESELAKGGDNVVLVNENGDTCKLDSDICYLGKFHAKTAIRQFARGEKVTGAKVLNGKFYPVFKANAKPATEDEPVIVETVNVEEQSTNTESANENSEHNAELVNQLKTFNAKVRGLSFEEFLAENAGLPFAEYREQKAAAENGIAKLEIEFKIEDIKSEIGRLESENYYTARNLYGIVVLEKHYATDESLQAYAAELVAEFNDRLGKINEAQAELATLAPATAETANVEETDREKFLKAKEQIKAAPDKLLGNGNFTTKWLVRDEHGNWKRTNKGNAATILNAFGLDIFTYLDEHEKWVVENVAISARNAAAEDFACRIVAPAKMLALPAPAPESETKTANVEETAAVEGSDAEFIAEMAYVAEQRDYIAKCFADKLNAQAPEGWAVTYEVKVTPNDDLTDYTVETPHYVTFNGKTVAQVERVTVNEIEHAAEFFAQFTPAPADDFAAKLAAFDAEVVKAETNRDAAKAAYEQADADARKAFTARFEFVESIAGDLTRKLRDTCAGNCLIQTTTTSGCPITIGDFDNIYIDATTSSRFVFVTWNNRPLAHYNTPAQVEAVINLLKDTIANGADAFAFPAVAELTAPPETPEPETPEPEMAAEESAPTPAPVRYVATQITYPNGHEGEPTREVSKTFDNLDDAAKFIADDNPFIETETGCRKFAYNGYYFGGVHWAGYRIETTDGKILVEADIYEVKGDESIDDLVCKYIDANDNFIIPDVPVYLEPEFQDDYNTYYKSVGKDDDNDDTPPDSAPETVAAESPTESDDDYTPMLISQDGINYEPFTSDYVVTSDRFSLKADGYPVIEYRTHSPAFVDTVASVARICDTVNASAPRGWDLYYEVKTNLFIVEHDGRDVDRLTSVELYDTLDAHPPEEFFDAYQPHPAVEFDDDGNISAIWF